MRAAGPSNGASGKSPAKLTPDHPIIITFLVFAAIAFMSLAAEVLKPLALAVLLSFALAPVARFIEHLRAPRFLAVVLTVLLALVVLAGIGFEVGSQLTELATHTDKYEKNIRAKLKRMQPNESGTIDKLTKVGRDMNKALDNPTTTPGVVPVSIVGRANYQQQLREAVGPYLENLAVGAFVLILVLFILANREDLRERMVQLVGLSKVSLTTKTMEEVGQRISRYLGMFTIVNSTVGLIVGVGLSLIGVRYAVLWGVLAALLRFIPYVGPATAFALPLLFSFADTGDASMRQPLMVVGLFVSLEVLANSFFEPVIYGRTTGVSALGLLVAAMFWTWLWGSLGLLLSTPLTVCLAVLGKSVPGLGFFATLLGEEVPLEPDIRFYQRLLAMDQDGADEIVEAEFKRRPRAEVFDQILIPTLVRCGRDHQREDIDDREQAFVWRVIGDVLDDLEGTPEVDLKTLAPLATNPEAGALVGRVLGVAANDYADVLALKMLALLLKPSDCAVEIVQAPDSPLELVEQVGEYDPKVLVISHLPPVGATRARYLVRRLRARFADLPIVVGRWGEAGSTASTERLTSVGASTVANRLAETRDRILPKAEPVNYGTIPSVATVPA